MKKAITKILAILLSFNMLISSIGIETVKAADVSANFFVFNESYTTLLPGSTVRPMYFSLNSFNSYQKHLLTYHIDDGREIQFTIERDVSDPSKSIVRYKILDLTKDEENFEDNYVKLFGSNSMYQTYLYTNNDFVNTTVLPRELETNVSKIILPTDEDFNLNNNEVKFHLYRGYDFTFKLDASDGAPETINFRWWPLVPGSTTETFSFITDAARPLGKYYDFNLKGGSQAGYTAEKTINVFAGWGSSALESQRFADDDEHPDEGRYLDKVSYPNAPDPGTNPGLKLKLEYPWTWDSSLKRFVQLDENSPEIDFQSSITISLGGGPTRQDGMNIYLNDIYTFDSDSSENEHIRDSSTTAGEKIVMSAKRIIEQNRKKIEVSLSNADGFDMIKPSVMYDASTINLFRDLSASNDPTKDQTFLRVTDVAAGEIYTYLRYYIIGAGSNNFLMYIEPYVYNTTSVNTQTGTRPGVAGVYKIDYLNNDKPDQPGSGTYTPYIDLNYDPGSSSTPLAISLDIGTESDTVNAAPWYRITFRPQASINSIESQQLKYKPNEDDVVRGAPSNFTVLSSKVVTDRTDNRYLSLELFWEIGPHRHLQTLRAQSAAALDEPIQSYDGQTMTYMFGKSLYPSGSPRSDFLWIDAKLSPVEGGLETTINSSDITINQSKTTSDIRLITGDGNTEYYPAYRTQTTSGTSVAIGAIKVTLLIPVASKGTEINDDEIPFLYPSSYFIDVANEYSVPIRNESGDISYAYRRTNPGYIREILLDDVERLEVPSPTVNSVQLRSGFEQKSFILEWAPLADATLDFKNYEKFMLIPKDLTIGDDSITYNIYISQNSSKLTAEDSNDRDVSQSLMEIQEPKKATTDEELVSLLRSGELVKIESIPHENIPAQTHIFDNMDKNQSYYLLMEAVIVPYEIEEDGTLTKRPDKAEYSKPSRVVTITTKDDPDEPGPSDITPETPTGLTKTNIKPNSATILWNRISLPSNAEYAVEYQILRTTYGQLKGTEEGDINYETEKISLNELLEKLETDRKGIRTKAMQTQYTDVLEYEHATNSLREPNPGTLFYYPENPNDSSQHMLTDATLSPNNVYYYYVRRITVELDTEGNPTTKVIKYSNWAGLSTTTPPVERPINLTIERDLIENPLTEMVIRFDATVTPENLTKGTDEGQRFEYSLKEEGLPWDDPVLMTSASDLDELTTRAVYIQSTGYYRYIYTIKNLKPGKSYSIRVRVYDKEYQDHSQYSDTKMHRTEEDPDHDPDPDPTPELEEIKNRLQDLIKLPYWKIVDDDDDFEAVYRTSMFDGEIQKSTIGNINIGINTTRTQTYYIPQETLIKINNSGRGITLTAGDISITIPANALVEGTTEAIKEQQVLIRENSSKDYFVKIILELRSLSTRPDGNDPLTPQIIFSIETVAARETEKKWNDHIYNLLLDEIINNDTITAENAEELKSALLLEEPPEEILNLIKEIVADLEGNMNNMVSEELDDLLRTSETYEVTTLEKALTVLAKVDMTKTVYGYQYTSGTWVRRDTITYGDKKGFSTLEPTTYVFTGVAISTPGVSSLPNSSIITEMIAKYQLNDYFGNGISFNLSSNATTNMLVGSVARIAGAPYTADPYQWLNTKGISVSSANAVNNIQTQEATYLIMSLYEIKTNTKVQTIRITNYNATANMSGLDPRYRSSVSAAISIGILKLPAQPRASITVRQILEMLGALGTKTKL